MAVVPFNPYVVHARRAAREAQSRAAAASAREQARPRTRLPDPPAPMPRLRVNLSPTAAMRTLCILGLAVAVCATVAAILGLVTAHGSGATGQAPVLLGRLTAWMASLPWVFLAVTLLAVASIERLVARADSRTWLGLALAALALAASQALGGVMVDAVPPLVRVGVLMALLGVAGIALREFFSTDSGPVRLQITGGVTGGFLAAVAPFAMLGQALLPASERTTTLVGLLTGCDALLGLVIATLTVHATLVYVRDYLPDFTIALDTADDAPRENKRPAAK